MILERMIAANQLEDSQQHNVREILLSHHYHQGNKGLLPNVSCKRLRKDSDKEYSDTCMNYSDTPSNVKVFIIFMFMDTLSDKWCTPP